MPSYKVILKDKTEYRVTADDVSTNDNEQGEPRWFNFIKENETTVAAFPFDLVEAVIS